MPVIHTDDCRKSPSSHKLEKTAVYSAVRLGGKKSLVSLYAADFIGQEHMTYAHDKPMKAFELCVSEWVCREVQYLPCQALLHTKPPRLKPVNLSFGNCWTLEGSADTHLHIYIHTRTCTQMSTSDKMELDFLFFPLLCVWEARENCSLNHPPNQPSLLCS